MITRSYKVMAQCCRFLLVLFCLSQYKVVLADNNDALRLLNLMTQAMQDKSYYGNFVYLNDNKLESMVFVHRKQGDVVNERLYSLNGEAREILRENDVLTCILPNAKSVVVDNSMVNSQLPAKLPINLEQLKGSYELKILGTERIADLQTRIVSIQPKDSYRYGYKYWIDEASNLLVKTSVMNENGQTVEQLMFTELRVGGVDEHLLKPVSKSGAFQKHEVHPQSSSVLPKVADSKWRVRMLPHGFRLTMHQRKMKPKISEHMVFSDGMSSLSVFIKQKNTNKQVLDGYSNMGAVNAFGRYEDQYHITAVGEVPAQTARLIGESLVIKTP